MPVARSRSAPPATPVQTPMLTDTTQGQPKLFAFATPISVKKAIENASATRIVPTGGGTKRVM